MDAITESYVKHPSSNDCAFLNLDPGNPCWGKVTEEYTGAGGQSYFIFACQGHRDKVFGGWDNKYRPESKVG